MTIINGPTDGDGGKSIDAAPATNMDNSPSAADADDEAKDLTQFVVVSDDEALSDFPDVSAYKIQQPAEGRIALKSRDEIGDLDPDRSLELSLERAFAKLNCAANAQEMLPDDALVSELTSAIADIDANAVADFDESVDPAPVESNPTPKLYDADIGSAGDSLPANSSLGESEPSPVELERKPVELERKLVESTVLPELEDAHIGSACDSLPANSSLGESGPTPVETKMTPVESKTTPVESKTTIVESKSIIVESSGPPELDDADIESVSLSDPALDESKSTSVETKPTPVKSKSTSVKLKPTPVESTAPPQLGDADIGSAGDSLPTHISRQKTAAEQLPPLQKGDKFASMLQRMLALREPCVPCQTERPDTLVNVESCLILDLLAMRDAQMREMYLLKCAMERGLLVLDPTTNRLQVAESLTLPALLFDTEQCESSGNRALANLLLSELLEPEQGVAPAASVPPKTNATVKGLSSACPTDNGKKTAPPVEETPAVAKDTKSTVLAPAPKAKKSVTAAVPAVPAKKSQTSAATVKGHSSACPTDNGKKTAPLVEKTPAVALPAKDTKSAVLAPAPKSKKSVTAAVPAVPAKKSQTPAVEPLGKAKKADVVPPSKAKKSSGVTKNAQAPVLNVMPPGKPAIAAHNGSVQAPAVRKRGARGGSGASAAPESTAQSFAHAYNNTILAKLDNLHKALVDERKHRQFGSIAECDEHEQFARSVAKRIRGLKGQSFGVPSGDCRPKPPAPSATNEKRPKPSLFNEHVNALVFRMVHHHRFCMRPLLEPPAGRTAADPFGHAPNVAIVEQFAARLAEAGCGRLLSGVLRVNAHNAQQSYITSPDRPDEDALIETMPLRQCAMHGDLVRVFVFNNDAHTRERLNALGFVVGIAERRHDRLMLGTLRPLRAQRVWQLEPSDGRMPKLRIPMAADAAQLSETSLYQVRFVGWKDGGHLLGELVREVGDQSRLRTQNEAILLQNRLKVPAFETDTLRRQIDDWTRFVIPAEELARRSDLRAECVFTIDPETARDLDDALSVRRLPDGNWEVGVHISDVSYFVQEADELDLLVRDQATTIYLVDSVYHMLPRELCELCSLLPGTDRLAFSVFWEFADGGGEVLRSRYERTVIRSCVQLAYAHAQSILDAQAAQDAGKPAAGKAPTLPPIHGPFRVDQVTESVRQLHRLAALLRDKRSQRHCLQLDQPKITFRLDADTGEPLAFERCARDSANWLIEEFMLLANETVAQSVYDAYPDRALLRNHLPPKAKPIEALAKKMRLHDERMRIDCSSAERLSQTLSALLANGTLSKEQHYVMNDWLRRPMRRANYICSGLDAERSHFALAIPIYTHFTSPIRRYADIVVHRLLAAHLGLAERAPAMSAEQLGAVAERCNEQKYAAKCAGDASTELYFMRYVRYQQGLLMGAVVLEVFSNSFEIMLIDTGARMMINIGKQPMKVDFCITKRSPMEGLLMFLDHIPGTLECPSPQFVSVFTHMNVWVKATSSNGLQASLSTF